MKETVVDEAVALADAPAARAFGVWVGPPIPHERWDAAIRAAVVVAHVVTLQRVVEALREADVRENVDGDFGISAADFIEREFGNG